MLRGSVHPKKKDENEDVHIEGVPEPVRESIYDILMKNLKLIGRATFIHRIIYLGEHYFMGEQDKLSRIFLEIIDQVNGEDHLERLSGFLLTYKKYFIHMVEGDEDSINRHIQLLLENKDHMQHLGTMKILVCVHHINQRFHESWTSFSGYPPKLVEDIDVNSTVEETGRHIYTCIKKMYKLIYSYYGGTVHSSVVDMTPCASAGGISTVSVEMMGADTHGKGGSETSVGTASHLSSQSARMSANLEYRNTLPEHELVKFIIRSRCTQTLQSYYELYRLVPQRDIYKDRVWPIPSDFVPFDVFSKPYDTVVELPKDRTEARPKLLSTAAENNQQKKSLVEQIL